MLENILQGISICFQPMNLFLAFMGCLMGTLIGVLPGLGPVAAIALLIPTTFHLTPVGALIMLAAIYYGAMYGGSTTSILLNVPGEAASAVTCLDGYQMAKKGRAGPALGIAAMGSFIAGTISIVLLMIMAPLLAEAALKFGPPEYTSLMILGFVMLSFLVRDMRKGLMMAAFGLFLATIGMDTISGKNRFTFNLYELKDGVGLIPVIMGIFGISEVLINLEQNIKAEVLKTNLRSLLPGRKDWSKSIGPIIRGSFLGFFLGILPGAGGTLGSFMSYALEKKISKYPEKFGTGVIEGVAGPESCNNSATTGSFIPLLSLGIPTNPVMAILLGALMIHGIEPGPLLMRQNPDVFWGVIMSMYIGNAMLLILNLPLIGMWVQVLKIPRQTIFPLILFFCIIGSYSISSSTFDIINMTIWGIVGYLMKKTGYEGAPLILGMVLGGLFEENLRQALLLSKGSGFIFFTRPISCVFLLTAILLVVLPIFLRLRNRKVLDTVVSD